MIITFPLLPRPDESWVQRRFYARFENSSRTIFKIMPKYPVRFWQWQAGAEASGLTALLKMFF
jgi:hypothetical protein